MSLQIRDLEKSFGGRLLFSGCNFSINPGECVALVGANGSGKTTLMRIILGKENADKGKITWPRDAVIGYLPQEIFFEDEAGWEKQEQEKSLWDLVSEAFTKLREVERQLKKIDGRIAEGDMSAGLIDERDRLEIEFEKLGGFNWQARMIRILKGMGFSQERFHEPLAHFSGGWRMRAYFSRLLLSSPDFLLLDEPTNYLDISSITFLEEYLASYSGGILVVSHDRYFLDNLANAVIALLPDGVKNFRGNYSDFLAAHEHWAQELESALKRREKEVARIKRFIERFRYKNTKASQVQSRIKMLAKMPEITLTQETRKLDFEFPRCQEPGEVVLTIKSLAKAYGTLKVLDPFDCMVYRKDRLAIIGENGAGKSTLMRIIAGQEKDFQGTLKWGYRVFPAYFAQDEEISFEKEETVWERMLREAPLDEVGNLRNLLGAFLFSGDMISRKVSTLSGGEKSRLGLARLLLKPCNLLLLDEPTNHLDIDSREALLDALIEFPGTIIFVSHDRYFLDSLATRILALDNRTATLYEGDYSQFLWARRKKWELQEPKKEGAKTELFRSAIKYEARDEWRTKKRLNNQKQRWTREITQVEERISNLEKRFAEVEEKLANPSPGMKREEITDLSTEHTSLRSQIDALMERWEELHRLLETK